MPVQNMRYISIIGQSYEYMIAHTPDAYLYSKPKEKDLTKEMYKQVSL